MNSSSTWKSGELVRIGGTYECRTCRQEGRETMKELRSGNVLPMCDLCAAKDATWKLIRRMESGPPGT
ncbi:MAG TPA: hypothetical protein VFG08_02300 [Candidatus Polarisedimenticolia bacterium]|nr:hypothetical protein [Candidatus Polarisedimenticolia bacterium]